MLAPNGKWTTYTTENSGLASDIINDLVLDKQDQVWIATYDGASVLAPNGQWTNYSKADLGLTDDDLWLSALDVDEQGRVSFNQNRLSASWRIPSRIEKSGS